MPHVTAPALLLQILLEHGAQFFDSAKSAAAVSTRDAVEAASVQDFTAPLLAPDREVRRLLGLVGYSLFSVSVLDSAL